MDPEKVIKLLSEYTVDWSRITVLTLIRPIARFELVAADLDGSSNIIEGVRSEKQLWLHPKLIIFALLSITLGLTINALIPNRRPGPELLASVIIIFIYWVISGSCLHLICLLLKGKGKYLETLSVLLQVSATLYVITSFLSLIAAIFLSYHPIANIVNKVPFIGNIFSRDPVLVFFLVGTILNMIYVPLAVKSVHKFGWVKTGIIALLPVTTVFFAIIQYMQFGLLMMAPLGK